jgi:hypothetical protein
MTEETKKTTLGELFELYQKFEDASRELQYDLFSGPVVSRANFEQLYRMKAMREEAEFREKHLAAYIRETESAQEHRKRATEIDSAAAEHDKELLALENRVATALEKIADLLGHRTG